MKFTHTRLNSKPRAWVVFLNQFLVTNGAGVQSGAGYDMYRKILKEDGLDVLLELWKEFTIEQYVQENISRDQLVKWNRFPPPVLRNLVDVRKNRGEPTGKPRGNPMFKVWAEERRLKREEEAKIIAEDDKTSK